MLLYSLQHQAMEEHVIEMALREGFPLPDTIINAPRLLPGLDLYLTAYQDLRTCAAQNGPVPWTAIDAWANTGRLNERQRWTLHHHIGAMDRAFLAWAKEKQP